MKIKKEDYERLKKAIDNFIKKDGIIEKINEWYQNNSNHSIEKLNIRMAWTLLNCTELKLCSIHTSSGENCILLYDYLNDSHIQTALLKILDECYYERIGK